MEQCFGVITKGKNHYFLASSVGECRTWVGVLKTSRTATAVQGKKVAQAPPALPGPGYGPQYGSSVGGSFVPHGYAGSGYGGVPDQRPYHTPSAPQPGSYAPVVPVYEEPVHFQQMHPVQGQPNVPGERYMPGEQFMPGEQYMSGQHYMPGQQHHSP